MPALCLSSVQHPGAEREVSVGRLVQICIQLCDRDGFAFCWFLAKLITGGPPRVYNHLCVRVSRIFAQREIPVAPHVVRAWCGAPGGPDLVFLDLDWLDDCLVVQAILGARFGTLGDGLDIAVRLEYRIVSMVVPLLAVVGASACLRALLSNRLRNNGDLIAILHAKPELEGVGQHLVHHQVDTVPSSRRAKSRPDRLKVRPNSDNKS